MLRIIVLPFLFLLLLSSGVWSYEAPEDKQNVFANKACPAFLTFENAAYLAGVTVELPCHCKPQEVQNVVWFFRKHRASSRETRALTDHHGNRLLDTSEVPHSSDLRSRFSIRLFSLLVFRAGPLDSGLYICGSAHRDFFFGFDLDIQEVQTLSFTPKLSQQNLRKESQEDTANIHPLFKVFTSFQPWSQCDRCGVEGEQVRVGLCFVHSHFLHVRYRSNNQTVASCGSEAVPKAFTQLKQSKVGPKMEVRRCQVSCPTEAPPPSKLMAFVAFLGSSSASQTTQMKVLYLSHPADTVLTLGCPGAHPDMAVAWDQESTPIYRFHQPSDGNVRATSARLLIDTGHHLVFQPAKTQDSGVYHCWLQGRRAAEIHLLVYAHLGRGKSVLLDPELPAAVEFVLKSYAVMTALFLLLLFCRAAFRLMKDSTAHHVD
ncbi:Ig-like V-type domain-containing protein FAM187A [Oryzias melastigma]|uniref:Family with sequence similarity 187 member A n=1 Tax=Oryzias melastigma TaxID=30732 RepID=A0A3B3DIG0_ORYME|nr:Ig-like V-type domain-containing protein FAM187A [Oryzias melastigma]